ncbi:MAG: sulfatase-like hydrolase/transferase [Bryobacteraceae bacterium]
MPRSLLHLLIVLSAMNVVYLREFHSVYRALSPTANYFRAQPFYSLLAASYYGSLLAMILFGFLTIEIMRKLGWLSEQGIFRLAGACIFFGLGTTIPSLIIRMSPVDIPVIHEGSAALIMGGIAAGAYFASGALAPGISARIGKTLVHLAMPLFFIQLISLGWQYAHAPSSAQLANGPRLTMRTQATPSAHIVWMVFDELDYELSLDLRPRSVEMPEFDRLRAESLSASDAHSPASATMVAFPSFFTGRGIKTAVPQGPDDLRLNFDSSEGKEQLLWKAQPTVFSYARDHGLNGAIVGWYHPYCRIFNSSLADCFWTPYIDALPSLRNEFILRQTGLLPVIPGWWGTSEEKQSSFVAGEQQLEYKEMLDHALTMVARRDLNLILLHWLIPHPPGIYDRNLNALHTSGSNYFDNLELVDVVLAEIRRKLENAGLWDDTILIITGDHPLRTSFWSHRPIWTDEEAQLCAKRKNPRVPLLIKLPHQHGSRIYAAPLNTVLIHDLLIRWLQGTNPTSEGVRAFFDQNRLRFPVLRTAAP